MTLVVGPPMLAHQYGLALLQGLGRFDTFNAVRLLSPVGYAVVITGLFVLGKGDLPRVTVAWVITSTLAGLVVWGIAGRLDSSSRESQSSQSHDKGPLLKEMLRFGLRGLVGSTSPLETFRFDQLAAGLILSPAALGLYVVGQAFGTLVRLLAQSAAMVAYPTVVRRGQEGTGPITVWRFFWAVTSINLLITVGLIAAVPTLIPFFFGAEFAPAIPLAQILLIGAALIASRRILVEGLRGLGHPQVSSLAEVSMYPWLLTGGALLMWHYGVTGLAFGVTIGFALSLAVAVRLAVRHQGTASSGTKQLSPDYDRQDNLSPVRTPKANRWIWK